MPASLDAVRFLSGMASGEPDSELLARFADRRDEAAFALLVRRHGAMVYGVCRRLLPEQDAEDAFQATFLVLARKARTAAPRDVGNWLFGVARRAALLSRRTIARRREQMGDVPDRSGEPDPLRELRAALDEELSRLPDAYRAVIILCDLEERTRREAAAILGWPQGTVAGRLVRAREMLAKRLARHAPSVSVVAILAGKASARVPEVLAPTATIPFGVAALTQGVLAVMFRGKIMKTAMFVCLALACTGLGVFLQAGQNPDPDKPVAPVVAEPAVKPPKADDVIWGKEVDGLQAGVVAATQVCRPGDTIRMEVRLRNVGKADIKIRYGNLQEHPPHFTDADGVRMTVDMPPRLGVIVVPTEHVLKSGETMSLYKPEIAVENVYRGKLGGPLLGGTPVILVLPGKYRLSFGGMIHSHPALSTGTLEFEVKDTKEAVTAWGEEINGLQAGLGFPAGQKRAYAHGETVTLVVRVRNVGKEEVKFQYVPTFFREKPPTVTDGDGKPVALGGFAVSGKRHPSVDVTLAPGEEIELYEWKRELRPAKWLGNDGVPSLYGAGKFRIRYWQVIGNSTASAIEIDPALSKLATGTLELDVKEKEGVTAWGKEAGGLQAGLEIAEKRAYRHGETVTLRVRVRNTGKETVKFGYIRQYLDENPPAVTGADGKPTPQSKTGVTGVIHARVEVSLEPGKEMVLESRIHGASGQPYELCPAGGEGAPSTQNHPLKVGTGKINLQYERVFGSSSIGNIEIDPKIAGLATGKLELEVVPAPTAVTIKNVTLTDIDEAGGTISVSFGRKDSPSKLVNVPLAVGVRVVASHVRPGSVNNLPFEWEYLNRLKGKVVSVRIIASVTGMSVVSIASGND